MAESTAGANDAKNKSESRVKDRTYWVAIICPNTQLPVPTGFGANKDSFQSSVYRSNRFSCPACGQMHVWDQPAAFLLVPTGSYIGEHFEEVTLLLDSSSFDHCTVVNCDVHLSRGNFRLTNCAISEARFNFLGEAAVVKTIADSLRG